MEKKELLRLISELRMIKNRLRDRELSFDECDLERFLHTVTSLDVTLRAHLFTAVVTHSAGSEFHLPTKR